MSNLVNDLIGKPIADLAKKLTEEEAAETIDTENEFVSVDLANKKDFTVSKEQIARAHKLSKNDELVIALSHPCVIPELKIGNYITEIEGQKIPDGDCKFVVEKIKYKKLKWWELWKSLRPWRYKRVVESYVARVM